MKFRIAFLIVLASLLTACNFTLAEDVTPPPNYIPPPPPPAPGQLYSPPAPRADPRETETTINAQMRN